MTPQPDGRRDDRDLLYVTVEDQPHFDDPGVTIIAERITHPPGGIAVAALAGRTGRGVVARIEFPMGIVDPASAALLDRLTR